VTVKVRSDGVLRVISTAFVRVGGGLKSVTAIKVREGGTLKTVAQFAPPISAVLSPTEVFGFASGTTAQYVQSTPITAVVTGGRSPFTYAWTATGATVVSPGMASTAVGKVIASDDTEIVPVSVIVTDAIGQTANASGNATLTNINFS
jgi:hypothetical protein